MKIWDSERIYDHILIADDVVCNPMNEKNISYYEYETIVYNKTEYIFSKRMVDNTTKNIIVCGDVWTVNTVHIGTIRYGIVRSTKR